MLETQHLLPHFLLGHGLDSSLLLLLEVHFLLHQISVALLVEALDEIRDLYIGNQLCLRLGPLLLLLAGFGIVTLVKVHELFLLLLLQGQVVFGLVVDWLNQLHLFKAVVREHLLKRDFLLKVSYLLLFVLQAFLKIFQCHEVHSRLGHTAHHCILPLHWWIAHTLFKPKNLSHC